MDCFFQPGKRAATGHTRVRVGAFEHHFWRRKQRQCYFCGCSHLLHIIVSEKTFARPSCYSKERREGHFVIIKKKITFRPTNKCGCRPTLTPSASAKCVIASGIGDTIRLSNYKNQIVVFFFFLIHNWGSCHTFIWFFSQWLPGYFVDVIKLSYFER